ncbi:DedA family protein [Acetobacter thailandicus]|uniref:DedA family protein n=1 Tax=Acetobacter thailandicus TaxID=1502842 RepID=UPI001BAC6F5E|nr:DedA family protein [Acetobacter thailandicus]MBS0960186.1 DedA family protein [Acetobacter thailandicus]
MHSFFSAEHLSSLLLQYGYGAIGVVVMLESMGLPLPAETLLIGSALFCATTHKLSIAGVMIAGVTGAIMGDNFGYLIGRRLGLKLLQKHGPKIGLTSERLLLGRYVFFQYGGPVVFLGRFVAVLRMFVALLAGANHMPWHTFLWYNALGGVCWAGGYTLCTYLLGNEIFKLSGPLAIVAGCCAVTVIGTSFLFLKKNEKRLTEEALKAAEQNEHLRIPSA